MTEFKIFYTKINDKGIEFFTGKRAPRSSEDFTRGYQEMVSGTTESGNYYKIAEDIFHDFQADFMEEETRELFQRICKQTEVKHTSMSVGDFIVFSENGEVEKVLLVASMGFKDITVDYVLPLR